MGLSGWESLIGGNLSCRGGRMGVFGLVKDEIRGWLDSESLYFWADFGVDFLLAVLSFKLGVQSDLIGSIIS